MAPQLTTAPPSSASAVTDKIASVLETTGYVLPALLLTLVVIVVVYPDRVPFTHPFIPGIPVMPGKRPLPLIGHTHHIIKNGTRNQFENIKTVTDQCESGVFQQTMLGLGKQFMIVRPEYIEAVQKTNFENFVKGPQFRVRFEDVLGAHGIFVSDGDVWKTQRKRASHIFSAGQFRNWVQQVVHGELRHVVSILEQVAAKQKAGARNNHVGLSELFFRYTLSSFSKMAFSHDMGALDGSPECLNRDVPFSIAFDFAQGVINERFVYPGFQIHELFSKNGREMRRARKVLREQGLNIISDRIAARKAEQDGLDHVQEKKKRAIEKEGRDLLDLFMDIDLDVDYLYYTTMNFLIAGRDTTAQSLSWLFYELFQHPEHVSEMVKEINSVCKGGLLQYDEVKRLPYTQACVAEAIRLHPAVPKNGKVCVKDVVLRPEGPNAAGLPDILVRKGEWCGWSDHVMARRHDVWGPDAEEYKPSRFIETDEKTGERSFKTYNLFHFHAFNGGPRLCLGQQLAYFEAMALCTAVLPRFNVSWTSKADGQTAEWPLQYLNSVTHPCEPYMADITLRE